MKTYYVLWTYIASFSKLFAVQALTPEHALRQATQVWEGNEDFRREATVYVFDAPPAFVRTQGINLSADTLRCVQSI